MSVLERHERFEIELLDALRRAKALDGIVFGGGTMLRLCHQMERYSVDLDFFQAEPARDFADGFERMTRAAEELGCSVTDSAEKRFSWLLELRRSGAPRRLKVEVRKDDAWAREREVGIAFSRFVPRLQVRVTICSLRQIWINKVEALRSRREIRDAYDLEFLLRRGAGRPDELTVGELRELRSIIAGFKSADFSSRLGTLLPPDERERVASQRLTLLVGAIERALSDRGD
jgi:predicted nucleotidyltransferase component of viral defense system